MPKAHSVNKVNKKLDCSKTKLSVRINFIKIKNFSLEKDTVKRMKMQVIPWEIIIVNHMFHKKTCIQNLQSTLQTEQECRLC